MITASLKDTVIPSVDVCKSILTRHIQKMGVPLDYDRMLEYYSYYTVIAERHRSLVEKYIHYESIVPMKETQMKGFLKKNLTDLSMFLKTDGGDISLSGESIELAIQSGRLSKEMETLVYYWSKYATYSRKVSVIANIINDYPVCPIETFDNHRMILVKPSVVEQNTGRLGMVQPAIMNLDRELGDIRTVPKGWIHHESDSGQIEPRIIISFFINDILVKKCILAYNDAYYGYLHYCTVLTPSERMDPNTVIKPLPITDELKVLRQQFKNFGNSTMYGSTENRLNNPNKAAFIRFLGGHPKRLKWQRECEAAIDRGVRVFHTAFGTPIDITKGPSDARKRAMGEKAYYDHLVICAMNNPVQGTAADLMRLSIVRANNLLQRKAPNSVITEYIHDSGKFAIHEDDYHKVIDELKEITAYQVDDWIPIYSDSTDGIKRSGPLERLLQ